jgi:hypothetical protein
MNGFIAIFSKTLGSSSRNHSLFSAGSFLSILIILLVGGCSSPNVPTIVIEEITTRAPEPTVLRFPTPIVLTITPTISPSETAIPSTTPTITNTPAPTQKYTFPSFPPVFETQWHLGDPDLPETIQSGYANIYTSEGHPNSSDVDSYLDLDSGSWGAVNSDVFLSVETDGDSIYYLEFVNGASAILVEESNANYDGCKSLRNGFSSEKLIVLDNLYNFICVKTSAGRRSLIYLARSSYLYEIYELQISFITWRND